MTSSTETTLELRSLDGVEWESLAAAFNAGFAGYAVPMALTAQALAAMQLRRGYDPSASVAAFTEDGRITGFALTCRDGDRLYNSGTGVVPAHRGAGLARQLVQHVIDHAPPGASAYVLEVIDSNAPAIALYQKLGFVETRGLQCWSYEAAATAATSADPAASSSPFAARPLALAELSPRAAAADVAADLRPSWQNTLSSIARATEPALLFSDEEGAATAVVFPSNGDVPYLHVRPAARRRGLATGLLAAAAAHLGKPLRLLNLDEGVPSVSAFLLAAGANRTLRQLEMIRPL